MSEAGYQGRVESCSMMTAPVRASITMLGVAWATPGKAAPEAASKNEIRRKAEGKDIKDTRSEFGRRGGGVAILRSRVQLKFRRAFDSLYDTNMLMR